MFVQMCIKGINGISLADAQAIMVRRGLACAWWRTARHITSAEIDDRLTAEELDLHVNSFAETHPTRGGLVRNETPFISLTAGSVERDEFMARNDVHSAHEVALNFATGLGEQGECFLFYCWVFVGLRPSVPVRHLAEEVRELHSYTKYSKFQPEGEIAAKIGVPARQIEKLEHYEYREDRRQQFRIRRLGIYDNPNYVGPHDVTNYRDRL
jgi:hypothetical protein